MPETYNLHVCGIYSLYGGNTKQQNVIYLKLDFKGFSLNKNNSFWANLIGKIRNIIYGKKRPFLKKHIHILIRGNINRWGK